MYKLINKLEHIIHSNFSYDFNKIENIIKSNEVYTELDLMEQELIMEEAVEKHAEISKKKKNLNESIPSYRDVKNFMKKSGYKFGVHVEEPLKIELDDGRVLTEGEIMSDRVYAKFITEPTKEDLERRKKIFEESAIISSTLPAQKSVEWHNSRRNKVNGSECGTLLNMNKHQAQYTFILDKVLGAEFRGNAFTYHGNVFEDVVRMMYEYNNDVHTEEFGSMPHTRNNPILNASPDGVVSPYCRDMKTPTKLVGRMLEIKCPTMRKIKYDSNIIDNICPIYYWCQIQQQLECLDLDECDFIQCNIERYSGREEWLADTHPECEFRSRKYGNLRGIVIELIPNKLSECDYNEKGYYADMTIWTKTKCLFPPKIDMSLKELDDWVLSELSKLPWGYTLHKIIYWRLVEQNCTLILRDKEWFQSQMPTYNKIWGYVEYLRANLDVCEKWKQWIDSQPRKYNDKVMAKLDLLIEEKKFEEIGGKPENTEIIVSKSSKSTKSTKSTKLINENKKGITINLDSDNEEQLPPIKYIKTEQIEQIEQNKQIEQIEQIEQIVKINQEENEDKQNLMVENVIIEQVDKVKRKYVRKAK
jgi:putative phage-type endonuclease